MKGLAVLRPHRAAVLLGVAVATAFVGPGLGRSGVALLPCPDGSGVRCATVTAPLDYSGKRPGKVQLAVEVLPARRPRGVVFLVAGGPGQASTKVFDLARHGSTWRRLFPGYTLVAYDDRGTGDSGALRCSGVLGGSSLAAVARAIGACGRSLGPKRVFYATRGHAEDIETVRAALGYPKIALWGTSYGTKQILAYARAHPGHVARLLLDSPVPLDGPDAFGADVLPSIPLGLASSCHGGLCRAATRNVAADVARLANGLAAKPLTARVFLGSGRPQSVRLDGLAFLQLVQGSDQNAGVAAELPAAVAAALAGRTAPLARLALLNRAGASEPKDTLDVALEVTTTCDDGPFPWQPNAAIAERRARIAAAVAALPRGSTGPFGSWAVRLGTYAFCQSWPVPAGGARLPAGQLPDVPVLVLSGDRDMHTPTARARTVAASFPQGRILVVPGVGHGVLTSDSSFCAFRGVQAWLAGKQPEPCRRVPALLPPLARFPASLSDIAPTGKFKGLRGRTLAATLATVREAEASWLASGRGSLPGLVGGRLEAVNDHSFALLRYSDVPGLVLTANVLVERSAGGSPLGRLQTFVVVSGSRAAPGVVAVRGKTVVASFRGKRG